MVKQLNLYLSTVSCAGTELFYSVDMNSASCSRNIDALDRTIISTHIFSNQYDVPEVESASSVNTL
jgi:hypothetical protein